MIPPATQTETLIAAYKVLFGTTGTVRLHTIETTSLALLKTAYRRRIMRMHPDKAMLVGVAPERLAARFEKLTAAYEILYDYIETLRTRPKADGHDAALADVRGRDESDGSCDVGPPPSRPVKPSKLGRDFHYKGSVPRTPLRLGRYLYYRGAISWNTLIESLRWQQMHRIPMGQIAVNLKYLALDDLAAILRRTAHGESFGSVARRIGKLTNKQIRTILEKQAPCRIGDYFVDQGILSRSELNRFVDDLDGHNSRFGYHRTELKSGA